MISLTLFECFRCTCVFIVRAFHYMGFFTARAFSLRKLFPCIFVFIARAFSLHVRFHRTGVCIARAFLLLLRFYQSFTEAIRILSTYLKSVYYFRNNFVISLVDLSTLVAPVFLELSRLGRDLSVYMYLSYHGN